MQDLPPPFYDDITPYKEKVRMLEDEIKSINKDIKDIKTNHLVHIERSMGKLSRGVLIMEGTMIILVPLVMAVLGLVIMLCRA